MLVLELHTHNGAIGRREQDGDRNGCSTCFARARIHIDPYKRINFTVTGGSAMYTEFVPLREDIESILRNLADGGAVLFQDSFTRGMLESLASLVLLHKLLPGAIPTLATGMTKGTQPTRVQTAAGLWGISKAGADLNVPPHLNKAAIKTQFCLPWHNGLRKCSGSELGQRLPLAF